MINRFKYMILAAGVISIVLISVSIHDPSTPTLFNLTGLKYTDIVHGLFYPIFSPSPNKIKERWFNESTYYLFRDGKYKCPVPYVDYKFEYPPLIGFLWYISTCSGFTIGSNLKEAVSIHYYINSFILVFFYLLMTIALIRLMNKTNSGVKNEKTTMIFRSIMLVSPSILMYLIYNWDIIASSLAVIGVLLYIERRHFTSGLFLGLSISAKILTAGIALFVLTKHLMHSRKDVALKYILGLAIACLIPFIALHVVSPIGFQEFINHHLKWYCENCIYMIFIRDIWSGLHSNIYYSLMTFGVFLFII
ncbi:MAG: glycosyltransferase 87 family protein, partial [Desulfurococcaceae archaeon]